MILKISVVVPTKNSERTIETCLISLLKNRNIHEIIIVDDSIDRTREIVSKYSVKLIHAPGKNISESRNLGIRSATGDIIAFTDSDCFVPVDWIEKACNYFKDPHVGTVGGPNLTPGDSTFPEWCAGMVLSSWFGTGVSVFRYSITNDKVKFIEADESKLLSCNLFSRKSVLTKIGLFNPNQIPCEENELLYRMRQSKFRLIYVPSLYVWHKRRPVFLPFMRQIHWYGIGRALFLRRFISSLKVIHIIPSMFAGGLVLGLILSLFHSSLRLVYGSVILIYFLLATIASIQVVAREKQKLTYIPHLIASFWSTHMAYGIGFMRGLFRSIHD